MVYIILRVTIDAILFKQIPPIVMSTVMIIEKIVQQIECDGLIKEKLSAIHNNQNFDQSIH